VQLGDQIDDYMKREVLRYVSDAWVDEDKTRVGYEISFNRCFYVYEPPRSLDEIQKDLSRIEDEIARLLVQVVE
jgi:type I restriction enzyme M protein